MPIYNSNSRGYVGLRNVGSYQVSGTPFITGSTNLDSTKCHRISFPNVSKSITIINTSANSTDEIDIHFVAGCEITDSGRGGGIGTLSSAGAVTTDVIANNNFITIPGGNASLTMDVKAKEFFVSNRTAGNDLSYQVFAELTQIPTGSMYILTGSGINGF